MKRIRFVATAVALIASTTMFAATAGAQTPATTTTTAPVADTLVVSPPVTEQDAAPGQTLEAKITITNSTSGERVFTATPKNAVATNDSGAPDLVPDEGPYALSSWLSITPNNIPIAAGKSLEFTVKIAVPTDAGPGSHSGAVVFSPSAPAASGGTAVSVVTEVSSLLLVNVSGDVRKTTSLQSFEAEKTFYQDGPVKFAAVFKNEGNLVSRPSGTVVVKNLFGKTVATLPVEPQRVLPTAERKFEVTWDRKNLLGPYTAQLTWNADDSSSKPSKIRIWGAPLNIIIPVLIGAVLLFLLLWLPRARWKAAIRALTQKPPAPPAPPAVPSAPGPLTEGNTATNEADPPPPDLTK